MIKICMRYISQLILRAVVVLSVEGIKNEAEVEHIKKDALQKEKEVAHKIK
ncbi:MAG: hypothetical protein WCI04_01055 [archaeon]